MSSLKTIEKRPFEDLLEMSGGYVLDFSNDTFASFFVESIGRDIYAERYGKYGQSKAKRLRAFWELDDDAAVGKVLSDLLDIWEYKHPVPSDAEKATVARCRAVAARLRRQPQEVKEYESEDQFLKRDYSTASLQNVPIDPNLIPILDARYQEALRCLNANAPLAAIFLSGSILEGLLLGMACANPQRFNQAAGSPKDLAGKVKPFPEWSLAQFIDVACALGYLKLDVKKFSHALRDFRNYIHPYQQLSSQFAPDRHTAQICLQVLKAAIASLGGQRTP